MWDIKLKSSKLTNKTNKQTFIDTGNNMVVTGGKGGGRVIMDKVGQIYGDRR